MEEKVVAQEVAPVMPMVCGLIQQAMNEIGAIGKDSAATNYNGKMMYKFRGIDAVYNALNPVMAKLGLFIIPEVLDQKREERQSTNGSTLIYSILTVKYTMYAPDGSSVSGIVIGEGMDSGDKASNKAMSAAMKYFCFQTFMIPTEDQIDADAEVHEVAPKNAPKPAPKPVVKDAAAKVETQKTLPTAPALNPVLNYLANEKAFIGEKLGLKTKKEVDTWFATKFNALVEAGTVENVPWNEMTRQQAENLIEAIKVTFMSGDPQ